MSVNVRSSPKADIASNRGVAAVDQEIGAGHEGGLLAGEVHRARGDLVRRAETADKRVVRGARSVQRVEVAQVARGLHRSRRQAVDAYILSGMVERHRLGQLDQSALGGAVPGPPRTRDASELRGDQDDASTATRFHGRNGVLAEQEGAIEIDRHGAAPVGEREAGQRRSGRSHTAFETSTWRPPNSRRAHATAASAVASSATSATSVATRPPAARTDVAIDASAAASMSTPLRAAPSAANRRPTAAPMPPSAPVTIATLPCRRIARSLASLARL